MRRLHSSHIFKKYRPYQSPWRRFLNHLKRVKQKKYSSIQIPNATFNRQAKIKSRNVGGFVANINVRNKYLIAFLIFVFWFILLMYLPYFRVTKVSIWGLENTDRVEINDFITKNYLKLDKYLPLNSYFLMNTRNISNALVDKFKLDSADVKKIFPNDLRVIIQEKKASIFYDDTVNYYLMDDNGQKLKILTSVGPDEFIYVISTTTIVSTTSDMKNINIKVTTTTKKHIPNFKQILSKFGERPILVDFRENNDLQTNVMTANILDSIIQCYEMLKIKKIVEPHYFIYRTSGAGIEIVTSKKWNIIYQPDSDLEKQIENLQLILKSSFPSEYVDLRFGGRVYWK